MPGLYHSANASEAQARGDNFTIIKYRPGRHISRYPDRDAGEAGMDFLPRMSTMQTLPPALPRHMSVELR